jgi:hypothetical protein
MSTYVTASKTRPEIGTEEVYDLLRELQVPKQVCQLLKNQGIDSTSLRQVNAAWLEVTSHGDTNMHNLNVTPLLHVDVIAEARCRQDHERLLAALSRFDDGEKEEISEQEKTDEQKRNERGRGEKNTCDKGEGGGRTKGNTAKGKKRN